MTDQEHKKKFNREMKSLCLQDPIFLLFMLNMRQQILRNKQASITDEQFKETMRQQQKALERIKNIKNN